eukprot:jgi/Picre1/30823/NNA_006183.t1
MTRTNPSIATESRQGILSFGQIAGPIDVEEQQEALVTKDIGAAGQGDMPFHHDDDDHHAPKKRKSPPQQDTIPYAHGMDGAVADAMHPEASSGSTMHSKKKNKKIKEEGENMMAWPSIIHRDCKILDEYIPNHSLVDQVVV